MRSSAILLRASPSWRSSRRAPQARTTGCRCSGSGWCSSARRQAHLEELAGEDFVTVPADFGFRSLIDDLLEAGGVGAHVSFESGDLATIEGIVGAGLGVAILPEQFAGISGTVGIALAADRAERVVALTWRTDRPLPPTSARFLEFLRHAGPFD